MKICVKNDVYIFLWPLDLQFAPWVTLVQVVQCYVSTEFEVSTVLLFQEDRRHGQVDGQTYINKITSGALSLSLLMELQSWFGVDITLLMYLCHLTLQKLL